MIITPKVTAIVVTHNSAAVVPLAIALLEVQTLKLASIQIVDSGSTDTSYVQMLQNRYPDTVRVHYHDNIGFAAANNRGLEAAPPDTTHFLFVNPDCFLTPEWLAEAMQDMDQKTVMSSPLYGFNIAADKPTGLYDSLGIDRTWYGRWYDIAQGEACRVLPVTPVEVSALCGALMLVPATVVHILLRQPGGFFDERFGMYKEDIDASLRLRRAGYKLIINRRLLAYHCRGWNKNRQQAPRWARRLSARNNIWLAMKHPWLLFYLPYYVVQYLWVRYGER
ncbi:MAG: glycosyltransferase family 2 protein [Holosporales bacterium]|jgi:N-acetylglucosaminyl-diphospho-decaprenol L-rhamnosyltransferase